MLAFSEGSLIRFLPALPVPGEVRARPVNSDRYSLSSHVRGLEKPAEVLTPKKGPKSKRPAGVRG